MKRIIAILLAMGMVLITLTGCTKDPERLPKEGVYYEIFVRAFADSDGDGIGDFRGIIDKLDYLNDGDPETTDDLGVTGIWLMPIMPAPSYHKYDTTDYYNVDDEYGSLDDFKDLLKECHKRGISVVIDLVINHTSIQHPWFVDALAGDPTYRDYYNFTTEAEATGEIDLNATVWGHNVWNKVGDDYYYAIFYDQQPDLNFENEAVRQEMLDVASFWLDLGVDGFRLDAAKHLYGDYEYAEDFNLTEKNVEWWEIFRAHVLSENENAVLVAEVWASSEEVQKYVSVFDVMFNFDVAEDLIQMLVAGNNESDLANELHYFYKALENTSDIYVDAPFLSNHDQNRIINSLSLDKEANKQAAVIYLTFPGVPFVYYGEELGMKGTKPDQYIRQPFLWGEADGYETTWVDKRYNKTTPTVDEQLADETSMLLHYRELIQLRYQYEALLSGDFEAGRTDNNQLLAYKRNTEDQSVLVVHNVSYQDTIYATDSLGSDSVSLIYSYNGAELVNGELSLPANSSAIVIVD